MSKLNGVMDHNILIAVDCGQWKGTESRSFTAPTMITFCVRWEKRKAVIMGLRDDVDEYPVARNQFLGEIKLTSTPETSMFTYFSERFLVCAIPTFITFFPRRLIAQRRLSLIDKHA